MVNTRQIGRKAEVECKALLEKSGWITQITDMPHQWKKQQDIFGIFDLIAKKGRYTKWIQVKSNQKPYGKVLKEFRLWGEQFCSPYETVEWWNRLKNKPKNERWNTHIIWCSEYET